MEKVKKLEHSARWYNFCKAIIMLYLKRNPRLYKRGGKLPQGGNLILANHVTRMDQFFVGAYYENSYIRFVSGENVFKNTLFRFFAEKCLNVIIHMRGVSAFETIQEMTRGLKNGENVMIFPTGSMTFDGRSHQIDTSIAKLAKMSSCNLVLLRSDGGYFVQPRWGVTTRKGDVSLTEYVISKDELKQMSAKDVASLINEHLYTDAYEKQAQNPISYKGKKLCKGLECCIYECPKCGKITNLKTSDSELICRCGYTAEYDEFGYLNGNNGTRYTITELCDSQKESLRKKFTAARNENKHEHIFGDDFELKYLGHDGKRSVAGNVRVDIYSDYIEYSINGIKKQLDYDKIDSVFVYMRNTLAVNIAKIEYGYELQGDFSNNALKYRDLFEILKELRSGEKGKN